MSDTPMQVLTRPFAIEPVTNIMMPDGIFDNALYHLRIAAHVTNMSGTARPRGTATSSFCSPC